MKKYLSLLFAVVLAVSFTACGNTEEENKTTTEIDTGIPDVQMFIEDNLTEDEYASGQDNRQFLVDSEGRDVAYKRWDGNGNTELEIFRSYHRDGRLYQELIKSYENGENYCTTMSQYEYTEGSKEAVVTVWENNHRRNRLETDSVVCTMTTKDSDLYVNSWQHDPLKIRGMLEYRWGMRLGDIEFIAGKQIEE